MDVFIVTVGIYDDKVILGVATSPEEAYGMIMTARESGHFASIERDGNEDTYEVTGPYTAGEIYDGSRFKL